MRKPDRGEDGACAARNPVKNQEPERGKEPSAGSRDRCIFRIRHRNTGTTGPLPVTGCGNRQRTISRGFARGMQPVGACLPKHHPDLDADCCKRERNDGTAEYHEPYQESPSFFL